MAERTIHSRSWFLPWKRCFVLFLFIVIHLSCDAVCADTQRKAPSKTLRAPSVEPARAPTPQLPIRVKAWTLYARMKNAAYPDTDAPAVAVHAPARFDPQKPLHLVVFLHGYQGCVRILMEKGEIACRPNGALGRGWGLSEHHDAASTNTLLIIPQLAFMKRDGNPGCFRNKGCFRRFLEELLSETLVEKFSRHLHIRDIESITLVAHSAGFETALAILQRGEVSSLVRNLVLMDALYAGVAGFVRWFSNTPIKEARIVSIYLGKGKTSRQSSLLHRRLEKRIGRERVVSTTSAELKPSIRSFPAVIASGRGPHGKVPVNYLTEVLTVLDLPSRK